LVARSYGAKARSRLDEKQPCIHVEDGLRGDAATQARRHPPPRFTLMMEQVDYLAELISVEYGKALSDAKGEVAYAAEFFR
jgi:hypothetical protein